MKHLLYSFILMGFLLSCGTENKPTYKLTTTVSPTEGGTISPSTGVFSKDEVVTLTGTPSSGWKFVRWEGDWSGETNPSTLTMTKDYSVIGVFEKRNYPLNITIEGNGTVEERIVQQKSTEYPFETVIELTPIPSLGWSFVEWGGDLSGSEVPKMVTMNEEKNVTVRFTSPILVGENGITIMCPNSEIGHKSVINGEIYETVDFSILIQRRNESRDLTKVCVSNVTDMRGLFSNSEFNQPIGNWDVSSVTDMSIMFFNSPFNQPIGDWDVNSVTDMSGMFFVSKFNQPIGDWDVSSVTSMSGMFRNSPFNQPIGNWNVSSVTNMREMFRNSPFNKPIGDWDVSSVTDMRWMFYNSEFNQPIGNWNVSSVTNMSGMFRNSPYNQPIGDWDVSSVIFMSWMFFDSPFNQPIGDWDVSSVTDMREMFYNSKFNQPINQWCVVNIPNEPSSFSSFSPLTPENKPIWGTCPSP